MASGSLPLYLLPFFLPGCAVICSVFLFFVMRRLLDIQGQLFVTRALAKEAAVQQQELLDSQPAGSGSAEQHRRLQHTLTKLDRVASDPSLDATALKAAAKRE